MTYFFIVIIFTTFVFTHFFFDNDLGLNMKRKNKPTVWLNVYIAFILKTHGFVSRIKNGKLCPSALS